MDDSYPDLPRLPAAGSPGERTGLLIIGEQGKLRLLGPWPLPAMVLEVAVASGE